MKRLLLAVLFLANVAANTSPGAGFGSSAASPARFTNIVGVGSLAALLKNQFFNYATCVQAATTSMNSVCQLYNPVGSGVNVILFQVRCATPTNVFVQLEVANTPRTTSLGTASPLSFGSGVVSKSVIYKDAIASLGTALITRQAPVGYVSAAPISTGLAFGPGQGIEAAVTTQNVQISCDFQFIETPQ